MRYCCLLLLFTTCSYADPSPVSKTFTVSATVVNGCLFGDGNNNNAQLGTINFGTLGDLHNGVDIISTAGAGAVVLTCTPGLSLTIALDYGLNNGSDSARYLSSTTTNTKLAYQLYQDASYSTVWGTGVQARSIASFPTTPQIYPVYARLFTTDTIPAGGVYKDTITVTVTW